MIPTISVDQNGVLYWWRELHAQAFGLNLASKMARPVIDQLFANGFFGCANLYAQTELGNAGACNYQAKPGYAPFQ